TIADNDPPPAPVLSGYTRVKELWLSWTPVPAVTHYKVSGTGYPSMLPSTVTATTIDLAVHQIDWVTQSYTVEACNAHGCRSSNALAAYDLMLPAIGYFKAFNTERGDNFGAGLALSGDGQTMAIGAPYEASGAAGING